MAALDNMLKHVSAGVAHRFLCVCVCVLLKFIWQFKITLLRILFLKRKVGFWCEFFCFFCSFYFKANKSHNLKIWSCFVVYLGHLLPTPACFPPAQLSLMLFKGKKKFFFYFIICKYHLFFLPFSQTEVFQAYLIGHKGRQITNMAQYIY